MQAAHGHIDLFGLHVLAVQLPALKGPLVAVHGDFLCRRDLHGDLVLHGVGSLIGRQGIHDFSGHAVVIAVSHAVGDGFISDIYIGPAIDLGICTNCMVLPCIPIPVIPFRMGVTRLIQRNVVRFQISLQRAAMESLAHEDILRASLVVVINRLYSYLLIVIDHGDDVGPAIDGDAIQAVRGVSGVLLVVVPGAIVIPAVKFILAGGIGCVVVADIQLAQVDDSALGLFVKFHGLVGRLKVAIAVDHHIDHLLGLPLGPQGDVLLNSIGEVILFIAQIPAVEGIAGLRGSGSRLGRGEAVFHFLVGRNRRATVRIKGDGILVDVPLRCQGDVLCDGSTKVIRGGGLLVFAQIPEGKGMALERRVVRLGRGEAVFHFLLGRNGRAAVGIKGDGILVDVPLRRQGDVACDRSIKVIRGGLLLVFAQIPERKGIALERRGDRQDSLLAALDVLLIGRRETAVSVEGNGIFLRHIYAALRLELPAVPGPDQRDRNDLLIVLDMFQGRERLVELGHIGVGDIADFAKPVVPDFLRTDDEVVFIVLAEQIVGVLMLLRIIYDALDLNSHFKLFQLVSRRGFGRGLGLAAFDFNVSINAVRAANQVPRVILPPPFDVGFLVWLRIGVGFADILIEPRNVFRFVQFDGIEVCSFVLSHAFVCVCIGQEAIVDRVRIMLGRILGALHTNFDLLIFKVRLRVAGFVRLRIGLRIGLGLGAGDADAHRGGIVLGRVPFAVRTVIPVNGFRLCSSGQAVLAVFSKLRIHGVHPWRIVDRHRADIGIFARADPGGAVIHSDRTHGVAVFHVFQALIRIGMGLFPIAFEHDREFTLIAVCTLVAARVRLVGLGNGRGDIHRVFHGAFEPLRSPAVLERITALAEGVVKTDGNDRPASLLGRDIDLQAVCAVKIAALPFADANVLLAVIRLLHFHDIRVAGGRLCAAVGHGIIGDSGVSAGHF